MVRWSANLFRKDVLNNFLSFSFASGLFEVLEEWFREKHGHADFIEAMETFFRDIKNSQRSLWSVQDDGSNVYDVTWYEYMSLYIALVL